MDHEFWHERWSNNEIGFHLKEVNPHLAAFWPTLDLPSGSRVLVPLCGKTLDMAWLMAQGHRVLGVELSRTAAEAFFAEQGLDYTVEEQGAFRRYRADGLEIWNGDFFALTAADVADCRALYDRAALIALPPEMRERYVAQLNAILPADCCGLLIALEYPQAQMDGPPFSVAEAEVRSRLSVRWKLEQVKRFDALRYNERFRERGLLELHEVVYRLQRP